MNISSYKILITGSDGQVGQTLREHLSPNTSLLCLSKHVLDITNKQQVENLLAAQRPNIVINTAAYTQVDKAETESDLANAVNQQGAYHLAIACAHHAIPLIHISTDYVFSGNKNISYLETDTAEPINHYGFSKWQGELAIQKYCEQALILRVSGVFSPYKQNFLKTMCHLAETRTELRVVNDQITCPTAASHIAKVIGQILEQPFTPGIFHYCDKSAVSWYEFAKTIIDTYKKYRPVKINNLISIPSSEYPTAARRPPYSALNCQKINDIYAIQQSNWQDGMIESIRVLCGDKA